MQISYQGCMDADTAEPDRLAIMQAGPAMVATARMRPRVPRLVLAASAGYQFAPGWRAFAGYNLIYWADVVRPGGTIDTTINPNATSAKRSRRRRLTCDLTQPIFGLVAKLRACIQLLARKRACYT